MPKFWLSVYSLASFSALYMCFTSKRSISNFANKDKLFEQSEQHETAFNIHFMMGKGSLESKSILDCKSKFSSFFIKKFKIKSCMALQFLQEIF